MTGNRALKLAVLAVIATTCGVDSDPAPGVKRRSDYVCRRL